MSTAETPAEALARIQAGFSKNDQLVILAFYEAGVSPDQIDPRVNVLTFNAWKAAGRRVARGATALQILTWVPIRDKGEGASEPAADESGEKDKPRGGMRPKAAYVFHISQTVPADAPKGARPDAWRNPNLVKPGTYAEETASHDDSADLAAVPCCAAC